MAWSGEEGEDLKPGSLSKSCAVIYGKAVLGNRLGWEQNILLKPRGEHSCAVLCHSWLAGFGITFTACVRTVLLALDRAVGLQLWEAGCCRKPFLHLHLCVHEQPHLWWWSTCTIYPPPSDQLVVSVPRTF